MTHELKIMPEYFEAVALGNKTFEVRKDDRKYNVGDTLVLQEYSGHSLTGREVTVMVTYILRDRNYCKDGFCIIGIKITQQQSVERGRWIDCTFYDPYEKSYEQNFEYKCSCCGHMIYNKPNNDNQYCGHCGKRMIKDGNKEGKS
jgi:ASC-1-like (ASCH) protein